MNRFAYSFTGLVLVATAAHAQPAADVAGAIQADVTGAVQGPEAPAAQLPAQSPLPAEVAAPVPATPAADAAAGVSAALSDTEVDSFAKATVKLQQIQADATIAADQKQTAMAAAVTEAGLDPSKYNEIGAKVSADAELRARVQTAMARHAEHSDG